MSLKIASGLLFVACNLAFPYTSLAEESPDDTKAETPSASLSEIDGTALKLSITNGLVEFAKKVGKVNLDLEWSYLPEDPTLSAAAEKYFAVEPVTIIIDNADLIDSEKPWIKDVEDQLKQQDADNFLTEGLHISNLEELLSQESNTDNFNDYWLSREGEGRIVAATAINSSDYYGLLRDYNALRFLLRSDGNYISVNTDEKAKDDKLPVEFPIRLEDEITWKIKIYKFILREENKELKQEEIAFYRYSVKEEAEPFNLYFRNYSEDLKLKLKTSVTFNQSSNTIGILEPTLFGEDKAIDVAKFIDDSVADKFTTGADSKLDSVLEIIGGATVSNIISQGILGGTKNATIISGGLVSDDVVAPLLGSNLEFSPLNANSFGVLFGITANSNPALFLGPSFRTSAFTVSAGARVFDDDGDLDTDLGGVVSLDLSRLLGGRKAGQEIEIDNSVTGGNWGKVSSEIAQNVIGVNFDFKGLDNVDLGESGFLLVQTEKVDIQEGEKGGQVSKIEKGEPAAKISVQFKDVQDRGVLFVPRGTYKYTEVVTPNGCKLENIEDMADQQLIEDPQQSSIVLIEDNLVCS